LVTLANAGSMVSFRSAHMVGARPFRNASRRYRRRLTERVALAQTAANKGNPP
jgi:hypothetical protein